VPFFTSFRWSCSCFFGLGFGLGLKNLVLFTSLATTVFPLVQLLRWHLSRQDIHVIKAVHVRLNLFIRLRFDGVTYYQLTTYDETIEVLICCSSCRKSNCSRMTVESQSNRCLIVVATCNHGNDYEYWFLDTGSRNHRVLGLLCLCHKSRYGWDQRVGLLYGLRLLLLMLAVVQTNICCCGSKFSTATDPRCGSCAIDTYEACIRPGVAGNIAPERINLLPVRLMFTVASAPITVPRPRATAPLFGNVRQLSAHFDIVVLFLVHKRVIR